MKALDMKIQDALKQAETSRDDKADFVRETHSEDESRNFEIVFTLVMTTLALVSASIVFSGLITLGA